MNDYSDGRTRSGGTVRGLERKALQQHNAPLSYQRSVATIQGPDMEKTYFPPPSAHLSGGSNLVTRKNFFNTKFNCLHEGMTPMLKLTFQSHLLHIQLAGCYLESSFLLFLLPLESFSKLLTPTWIPTDFPIFLFHPSTHKPRLGNSHFEGALGT